jgi:hypothetical protein
MLFEKYPNEATFRADFVRPLLTKMGFLAVAELDGSQEFGKDFVFSELTPFGFFRHYGVVVKHEKAIRQTSSELCQTILSQVRQAFSVSFRLPDSSHESRVSAVLFLNSGSITPNATTWLRSELARERYGDNVHIFDGERLSQMDLQVAFQHRELLVPRLVGLETALKLNRVVWSSILKSLPSFSEGRGCFTQALEDYLAAPFLTTRLDSQAIATLLQECRIINTINQRYLSGLRYSDELKAREVETMRNLIAKADSRALALQSALQQCFSTFRLLSI